MTANQIAHQLLTLGATGTTPTFDHESGDVVGMIWWNGRNETAILPVPAMASTRAATAAAKLVRASYLASLRAAA